MQPERWREIEAVFEAVQERPADQQEAYLAQACGGDAELRQEVESLLRAASDTRFLDSSPLDSTRQSNDAVPEAKPDLLERLQRGLGTAYRVERELGGGGMARIFLATEAALRRQVVIKVLAPELAAGLNADRFRREVRLSASLQHPHVVPLHAAGETDGLLFYTMPFVAGESLRHRLEREGPLPVPEVVRLLREVADALGFAHRRGIVHRDLKPANILLSEGHALVADFGIAKAVVASSTTTTTTEGVTTSTLTSPGLVVGTPAYMAPEQAASDRGSDHRADLYALGCLAYELLTGRPPFQATSARGLFTAHLIEAPTAVSALRPEVSPTLNQMIMQLLAKDPAQRPQTATAVLESLDAVSAELAHPVALPRTSVTTSPAAPYPALAKRRRKLPGRAALVVAAAFGAGAVGYAVFRLLSPPEPTLLSTGRLKEREQLLVADFENRTPDSLVGPAVTDAFRLDLGSSPVVTVMTPAKVSDALERMRRPAGTRLDATLAGELAVREGVKAVLIGQVARLGGGYLLSAQLVSPASGDVLAAYRETAPDSTQVIAAIDRLSSRIRARIGESLRSLRNEPPLDRVTTNSLQALEKYHQALYAAHTMSDAAKAVALLEEAVALDTGFAAAYRSLGGFLWMSGERDRAVAAYDQALRHRDRLTDQERDHTLGLYYSMVTGEIDKAIATYRGVLDRHPTDSLALGNLAGLYLELGQLAQTESLANRVIALDSLHPSQEVSLVYIWVLAAQIGLGRTRDAELTYQRMVRQYGDTNAHVGWASMMLPSSAGDFRTAETRAQVYGKQHLQIDDQQFARRQLAALASAQGRLAESDRYLRRALESGAAAGRAAEYLEYASVLAFGDIWFRKQPRRGLETVEAALRRFPLAGLKPLDRPYLPVAFAYAAGGQPQKARELLNEFEREIKPTYRRADETQRHWTWGAVAMAERRYADALREFQTFAAGRRNCIPCGLASLAQAYDRAGQPDSAIAVYERYITTPDATRLGSWRVGDDDATQLAPAHKRLGELYELRGDRERARRHYGRFIELWKNCDPELRPQVEETKQRLLQLTGDASTHTQ